MIHDFATLPRASQLAAPQPSAPPRQRRVGRYVVAVFILLVVGISLAASGNESPGNESSADEALLQTSSMPATSEPDTSARDISPLKREIIADSVAAESGDNVAPERNAAAAITKPAPDSDTLWSFYDRLAKAWPVPVRQGVYVDHTITDRERPVYELQAASFRHRQDAERLSYRLAERGLQAQVHSRTNPAGVDWHQVVVGPFDHSSTLNKAQDVLVSFNLMPLKRRVN